MCMPWSQSMHFKHLKALDGTNLQKIVKKLTVLS